MLLFLIIAIFTAIWLYPTTLCNAINGGSYFPSKSPPKDVVSAMEDDNNFLGFDYFIPRLPNLKEVSQNGEVLRQLNGENLRLVLYAENNNDHMLVWGNSNGDYKNGEYRFLGINKHGENITNIDFPLDVNIEYGAKLNNNEWIPEPWRSDIVAQKLAQKGEPPIFKSPWDGDDRFLPNIVFGLAAKHGAEFSWDGPQLNWTDYVHILEPPTYYGWGVGRAWHIKNGQVLYRTIPLYPSKFLYWLPNFYIKGFDPGCPVQDRGDASTGGSGSTVGDRVYMAEPGVIYRATVTFGVQTLETNADISAIPVFVKALSEEDSGAVGANLVYKSGNGRVTEPLSLYPYVPERLTNQAVIFKAQNSELTCSFDWTARPGTKRLTAAINYPPALRLFFEGLTGNRYEDNVSTVPIVLADLPDTFVHQLDPGTAEVKEGAEYQGTVGYGLYATFDEPVRARLGLTHNGWPIPGVDGLETTFRPGETKSFPFLFHGQKGDSVLEAKIWPLEPADRDINWNNNRKTVTVKPPVIDIGVESIQQISPVISGTNQLAGVSFRNLGNRRETFDVHYYAGDRRIKTETVTLEGTGRLNRAFNWTVPDSVGNIDLRVVADPGNQLQDINRSNNSAVRTVQVQKPALPPTECLANSSKLSGSWTETYWLIEDHDEEDNHIWAARNVIYNENLMATVRLNTKQGIPTDPRNLKPGDNESRGSWEIIPWSQENGLDPNKVTRAGYGFEVEVDTTYRTDYETKVPRGLHGTAGSKGGVLYGPSSVKVEFWDTANRSVEIIQLEAVSGSPGDANIGWALPEKKHILSDGTTVWDRKHYVDVKNTDGRYYVTVYIDGAGRSGLKLCKEDFVTIHGDMYDDMYTRPKQQ